MIQKDNNWQIIIKDDSGIEDLLKSEFHSQTEEVDFKNIYRIIQFIIEESLEKLRPIWPENEKLLVFSLEQSGRENILASFRENKSRKRRGLYFVIYYTSISELYRWIIGKPEVSGNHFQSIVIHELMHAVDSKVLYEHYKINEFVTSHINIQEVLNLWFEHVRAEGVEILAEYIFAYEFRKRYFSETYLESFAEGCHELVNTCNRISQQDEAHRTDDLLSEFRLKCSDAYEYAHLMLLHAMKYYFIKPKHKQLIDDLLCQDRRMITEEHVTILKLATKMDVSEFMVSIIRFSLVHQPVLINISDLQHLCHLSCVGYRPFGVDRCHQFRVDRSTSSSDISNLMRMGATKNRE